MSEHDLDLVSLVGGVVLAALGAVGLARHAGLLDGAAAFWAVVAVVAGLGLVGAGRSLYALARRPDPAENPRE